MRDTELIHVEYNDDKFQIVKMEDIPPFDVEDYDLFDDKKREDYFKSIERLCRTSYHYQQLTKFLRENCNMNACSFYENVNNINTFKIKIHIHHHPFTLYDIVTIVFNKRVANQEPLDEELVAKEVMFLHFNLLVGLIPLSETVHELVHNNYLFVPLYKVFGAFQKFANLYIDYIPQSTLDLLQKNIEASETFNENLESSNMHILNKNYVYLDLNDEYKNPDYVEMISFMNDKVNEIRNNQEQRRTQSSLKEPITFEI